MENCQVGNFWHCLHSLNMSVYSHTIVLCHVTAKDLTPRGHIRPGAGVYRGWGTEAGHGCSEVRSQWAAHVAIQRRIRCSLTNMGVRARGYRFILTLVRKGLTVTPLHVVHFVLGCAMRATLPCCRARLPRLQRSLVLIPRVVSQYSSFEIVCL